MNSFNNPEYDWSLIELLVGQRSIIDFSKLNINNKQDAINFVKIYGFDVENASDRRKIHAAIIEALNFIQIVLLNNKIDLYQLKMPSDILFCDNVIDLLLYASFKSQQLILYRLWACAILKVLHAIAHVEFTDKAINIKNASEQIISRFREHIYRDANGDLFLGFAEDKITLDKIDFKYSKSRNSIILKLLHKPTNIVDTIYDYVGVRIVIKKLSDVFKLIQYLGKFYVISYPNIISFRSKNNLIDYPRFKSTFEMLKNMADEGKIKSSDVEILLEKILIRKNPMDLNITNPYSSINYKSIQITCRELIKTKKLNENFINMVNILISKIKDDNSHDMPTNLLTSVLSFIDLHSEDKGMFFPFEVQILDTEAYEKVLQGDASHENYKSVQIQAVRRRILSEILHINNINFK